MTRWGFSEEDMAAGKCLMGLMEEAGVEVRVDPTGNMVGRRDIANGAEVLNRTILKLDAESAHR